MFETKIEILKSNILKRLKQFNVVFYTRYKYDFTKHSFV